MLYDYSYTAVIDGRNGQELWTSNSSQAVMASSITIASRARGNDGMLFVSHGGAATHHESRRETYQSCAREQADGEAHVCVATQRERRHSSTGESEATSDGHDSPGPGMVVIHLVEEEERVLKSAQLSAS